MNRALVVDDVAAERERMGAILRSAGWTVSTAASGLEAIERARADAPNIIFLDIVMPEMDGFQACRQLAADPTTRDIPVVFVSNKCQRADEVWARVLGCRGLIGKPYRGEQLIDALRHAA